jgi:hypothetical protein
MLLQVSGVSSSDVWVGGTAYRIIPVYDDSAAPQLIAHWDGSVWMQAAPAQPLPYRPPGPAPQFATQALTVGPDGTLWTSDLYNLNFSRIPGPLDFVTTLPDGCVPQPAPILPEAPWPWLLPVTAVGVGGLVIGSRRRRQRLIGP